MRRISLLITGAFFLFPCAFSQAPQSWTSAEMYQALRKLNVLGSVLYMAAHPDDENTRLISWLSKDRLYRTGYLSLTRGDGGQNLIGDEQGIELGLIRTQELLAARRVDGGEQFFTRAFDFGYSKSPEETFTKWDKEKILADVVWVIRQFQPDVIVTRFSPVHQAGNHGHHTASAILANDAFAAAADPKRFPEQLKYVQPWQVKRILWNTFNFGGNNQTSEDQFKFDVGGYNPLIGKSYGEISATSRSNHKSQGFGSAASRGEALEYFRTVSGDAPKTELLDGVDQSWQRVKGGEIIQKIVDSLSASFDFLHPERSVKGLVRLYAALNAIPEGHWKNQKLKETKTLIEQCSGLFMDVTANNQFAIQTDSIRFNFTFNNRLGTNATLKRVSTAGLDSTFNQPLAKNRNVFFGKTIYVPASIPVTQPYWLAKKMEEGYFNVTEQQKIGQADVDPAYIVNITLNVEGQDVNFARTIKFRFTDPVKGELYEPLVVLPPVEFDFVNENNFSINDSVARVQVHFKSNVKDSVNYDFAVVHSEKWMADKINFQYGTWGNPSNYVSPRFNPRKKDANARESLKVSLKKGSSPLYAGYRKYISYDHIPYINYFKDAEANLVQIKVKTYGNKIGYIIGAGDKVPEALEQIGYDVTLLTDKELSRNNLRQFDAIITGVRTYNTNDWMGKYYDKLMKYVSEGGNFIVQYNTAFRGNQQPKIGPYKFDVVNRRITDENAAVTLLKPDHPVLNFPNKITADDFKGWVQERSIYHAGAWDSTKYETIIAMNDPGEKQEEGSLIIARHGKGVFVYTGIVFFRELPAGVPGAYRLLANIIALNSKKGF
jgi:LmbE family N-acetylglucosaminyl deacetylase